MSSVHGGREDVGGDDEDVEADKSTRTEHETIELIAEHDNGEEEGVEFGVFEEPESEMVLIQEQDTDDENDEIDLPLEDEGSIQAHREESNNSKDSSPEIIPSNRIPSDIARSPPNSESIPDDTPSLRDSLASSPVRVGSPRRIPSRTASAALQPFERRFETRLSVSPSTSPRGPSPAFLGAHSRQWSLSSQISQVSSQDDTASNDTPQVPWDVMKWTSLRKIAAQAFSEAGRRNFGRPTCLAVSAFIAIGTSKGLILGFDYHQTLKIIIGQGTTATECGSVTALAIAADFSTVAAGHSNGHIFTWEVNRPARPFLRVPPISQNSLLEQGHPHGHVEGTAILHIGFLGTRHTALVSADAGGMAFSHLATRGLGPVTRSIKSTRLLGRYSPADPSMRNKKPSSVLAFSPLPLGNVEQPSDSVGLTALLTPYLLVIVSTTPIAQTQYKSPRPKEIKPHSTLSGCLAWFPAVKLKASNQVGPKMTSDTKLVYCWSNVVSLLHVESIDNEDANKPPNFRFHAKGRWHAEETIVAVQWLGRSVVGVLTISQRLMILEDTKLQVTDSIDLLRKHIYHQDLFSEQLQTVVERLDANDPELHGVVADAFYMSFKVYKGRTFLLCFDGVAVGTLSNWADRLMALMESGDHIAAIRLATGYYAGAASNVAVGLPDAEAARHSVVRDRLVAMISASLHYTFSQHNDSRWARIQELAQVTFDACITMSEIDFLFNEAFDIFENADEEGAFVVALEPYVLDGEVKTLPPNVIKSLVSHYISEGQALGLEELICRLDPLSFDLDEMTMLCRQHRLYDALIYLWTRAIGDFVTPLIELLSLIGLLDGDEDVEQNPFFESAMKLYPYLAYTLTGRRYPGGEPLADSVVDTAKEEVYNYVFSGRPMAWPQGSDKVFHTADTPAQEPVFPYLVLLLEFDAASCMSMFNEAFEDSFLNEADDQSPAGTSVSGSRSLQMTRQHIIEIMLEVMQKDSFDADQIVYLDMFVARSLAKYPGQLVLTGSLLTRILERLCHPPSETLREDCQLSAEYLLSVYHPSDLSAVLAWLRAARFFRILKSMYRGQKMYIDLIKSYFDDLEDRVGVFDGIKTSIQGTAASPAKSAAVKQEISKHFNELCKIDAVATAQTLAVAVPDLLQPAIAALQDPRHRFLFLRSLLEPHRLDDNVGSAGRVPLPGTEQGIFIEPYVQLMCVYDPKHVAEYVGVIPSGDLHLDKVLSAMEQSGVVDAAVVLLARDGLAQDAMERLTKHIYSLQKILASLIENMDRNPDTGSMKEASDDISAEIEKYVKVGIWLCQGQTAHTQRRQRTRAPSTWNLTEEDLDLDEFLWLNLIDAVVKVSRDTSLAVEEIQGDAAEMIQEPFDFQSILTALRTSVQSVFTVLLTVTATSQHRVNGEVSTHKKTRQDSLSFIYVLRAFLTRAASTTPSLSELRQVLSDIFAAYTFEQGVLSLANELLGSDVFHDMEAASGLRQQGWRPRTQVCEHCKRRAWGQGIGEEVWDEWVSREQGRASEKTRKYVERGGGEEARRLERGKGKASGNSSSNSTPTRQQQKPEETRRLTLVVFACRHVYHRVCLDEDYRNGKPPKAERYRCPLCPQ